MLDFWWFFIVSLTSQPWIQKLKHTPKYSYIPHTNTLLKNLQKGKIHTQGRGRELSSKLHPPQAHKTKPTQQTILTHTRQSTPLSTIQSSGREGLHPPNKIRQPTYNSPRKPYKPWTIHTHTHIHTHARKHIGKYIQTQLQIQIKIHMYVCLFMCSSL